MALYRMVPRTGWQSAMQPVTGPLRRQPFRQGVIHWEGDNAGVPADVGAWLRTMQATYLRTRGYSLGYGFAVVSQADHAANGSLWGIRQFDLNMASNPGDKVPGNANDWTGSVLVMGRPTDHVTPEAAASVRSLFAEWHVRDDTAPVRPIAHSDLDYTECCGPLYRADIAAGLFDPTTTRPPAARPTMHPFAVRIEGVTLGAQAQNLVKLGVPAGAIGAQVRVSLAAHPAAAGWVACWSPSEFWKGTATVNFQPGQIDGGTTFVGVNGAGECFVMASTDCIVNVDVQGYA